MPYLCSLYRSANACKQFAQAKTTGTLQEEIMAHKPEKIGDIQKIWKDLRIPLSIIFFLK